jgi:putative FmdB family regulatory protein
VPIYEFRCRDCDATTEVITRSISSSVDAHCDSCGSTNLERLVSRIIPHQTEKTKYDQLDPRYDRWVDDTMAKSKRQAREDITQIRAQEAKAIRDAKREREKKKIV